MYHIQRAKMPAALLRETMHMIRSCSCRLASVDVACIWHFLHEGQTIADGAEVQQNEVHAGLSSQTSLVHQCLLV